MTRCPHCGAPASRQRPSLVTSPSLWRPTRTDRAFALLGTLLGPTLFAGWRN